MSDKGKGKAAEGRISERGNWGDAFLESLLDPCHSLSNKASTENRKSKGYRERMCLLKTVKFIHKVLLSRTVFH